MENLFLFLFFCFYPLLCLSNKSINLKKKVWSDRQVILLLQLKCLMLLGEGTG